MVRVGVLGGGAPVQRLTSGKMTRVGTFPLCLLLQASSVACWVYVQKYVKQKTLDEMLQELPGAGQFIIVMDTWFEKLMAE